VFEKKVAELVGTKIFVAETLTGGGIINLGVGKSPKVLGLIHATNSGEARVLKLSPSKMRPGEEKSARKFMKFKVLETPTNGITRETKIVTGVSKGRLSKLPKSPGLEVEVPS
jgi:hypothetical protein